MEKQKELSRKQYRRRQQKKKKIIIIIITILGILFLVLIGKIFIEFFSPTITLISHKKELGNSLTINYKEKYQAPEYIAKYQNKKIKVKITGTVNSNKIGDYKVYYRVKEGLFNKERMLLVKVRDTSAPEISLVGEKTTYVCPGKTYEEEGYKAYDNKDGDLTKKVKIKKEKDKITYTVKDEKDNQKKIVRKLIYKDKKEPTLELNGTTREYVYLGEEYQEPGVKATDICDGDLSSTIKTEGTIDTNKTGEYTLTYTVNDKAGNTSSITRTVEVVEHAPNGTIYLTFDDGPKQGTTNVILDILKEENVKATFFITNGGPDELVLREYQEGHTVGLHTASHDYSYVYSSVENYYQDLYSVRDRVTRITGYTPNIIRFPGGSSNTISRRYQPGIMSTLTRDVLEKGFRYYDWNLSSGDAGEYNTSDEIYNQVVNHLSKDRANIILMHDIKTYTRDALRNIIHYGKENGYRFDRITDKTEMMTQRVNN